MEELDANTTQDSSSVPEFYETPSGLVSTVEFKTPEPVEAEPTDTTSDTAEQNTEEQKGKDFHEHPRFQELISKNRDLQEQIKALKEPKEEPKKDAKPPSYQNILEMEDEAIVDTFTNNPKQFVSNLAQQMFHEFKTQLESEQRTMTVQQQEQEALKRAEAFFASRPDGVEMLKDGRIRDYVQKNPEHNAISAYMMLTGDTALKTAASEAATKAKEETYKELKAKGRAQPAATAPGPKRLLPADSPDMKDPDKYGGIKEVLKSRMLARMRSR